MDNDELVARTGTYVKGRLEGEASGHDWWHVLRVMRIATHIAEAEKADLFTVQMAALLHDLDDWKFREEGEPDGPREAREWLETSGVDPPRIERICAIIEGMSFKGAHVPTPMDTLEGKVVQDADRLDAMGAVGIARAFAYGGRAGRPMHDPAAMPRMHESFEEYKAARGTSINHFHEKLLLLKDRMNTDTGKRMAQERDAFLRMFLQRFLEEWKG